MDEGELIRCVRAAQKGDTQSFSRLSRHYMPRLYAVIFPLLKSEQEVQDVLQESFIKAYRKLPSLKAVDAFQSWLYRIALNTAKNRLKQASFRRESALAPDHFLISQLPDKSSEGFEAKELQREVLDAMQVLSPDHQAVLNLVAFEELNCAEVAKVLDCPAGTVRSRLHYARKVMRKKLKHLLEGGL